MCFFIGLPSRKQKGTLFLPESDKIKLIDFGGATFEGEYKSRIISTRQYRAPEVIMGCCRWTHSADVWSLACIIIELATGSLYFQTHDNYEHLAMIEKSSGTFPQWMVSRADSEMDKYFRRSPSHSEKVETSPSSGSSSWNHLFFTELRVFGQKGSYLRWPEMIGDRESIDAVASMQTFDVFSTF